jgi:hypothetical protein
MNEADGENECENGPTTLISHLNDPDPNAEETMQVEPNEG